MLSDLVLSAEKNMNEVLEKIKGYKDLVAWQKAILLTDTVYSLTRNFPKEEIYGLSSQMRRSAVSVASNIAEGASRHNTPEFIQFLGIAKASLAELETQIIISARQNYLPEIEENKACLFIAEIDNMLFGLIKSLRSKRS